MLTLLAVIAKLSDKPAKYIVWGYLIESALEVTIDKLSTDGWPVTNLCRAVINANGAKSDVKTAECSFVCL